MATVEEIRDILKRAEKVYFTAGCTKYIYIGDIKDNVFDEAVKDAKREMLKGEKVTWADGREEWINHQAEWIDGDYVWNEDGNRVRIQRLHTVIDAEGHKTVTELPKTWRNYDLV